MLFQPLWSTTNFLQSCLRRPLASPIFSFQAGLMSCGCVFLVVRTVADSPFTPSSISLGSGFLSWFRRCWGFVDPGQGWVGHLRTEAAHRPHLG